MKKIFLILSFLVLCNAVVFAKDKIAVLPFEGIRNDYNMTILAENEMISTFVNTNRFIVIERGEINKILAEQKLSNSGLIDSAEVAEFGKIGGVKYIVSGKVSNVSYTVTRKTDNQGKAYNDVDALIILQIKMIDVTDGSIIFSHTYNIKNGSSFLGVLTISSGSNNPEEVLSDMLKKEYSKKISVDLLKSFPIYGTILSIEDKKTVIIDVGAEQGVYKGMSFDVVLVEQKTNASGETRNIVKKVAKLKVKEVSGADSATCKVSSATMDLEEGMQVIYSK